METTFNAQFPTKLRIGGLGEQLAAEYLSGLGWTIVARNWRCDQGEIDIAALEPASGPPIAVVVEVKSRSGLGFGSPLEAITADKLRRLNRLAVIWASQLDVPHRGLRVDALGVLKLAGQAPSFEHVRGIR